MNRCNVFRWYGSGWGRYTQADPIGVLGSLRVRQHPTWLPTAFAIEAATGGLPRILERLSGVYFQQAAGVPGHLYGYADADPNANSDRLGLEPVLCTVFREHVMPIPSPMGSLPGNVCRFTGTCGGGPSGKMYTFEKSDPFIYRFVPPCKECPVACVFTWETTVGGVTSGPLCYGKVPVDNSKGFKPGGGGFGGKGATGEW